jgi:hypothetical protein
VIPTKTYPKRGARFAVPRFPLPAHCIASLDGPSPQEGHPLTTYELLVIHSPLLSEQQHQEKLEQLKAVVREKRWLGRQTGRLGQAAALRSRSRSSARGFTP